jgi:hypothetical protein
MQQFKLLLGAKREFLRFESNKDVKRLCDDFLEETSPQYMVQVE